MIILDQNETGPGCLSKMALSPRAQSQSLLCEHAPMAVLESEFTALVDTLGEELPVPNSTVPATWGIADRSHQPIVMIPQKKLKFLSQFTDNP